MTARVPRALQRNMSISPAIIEVTRWIVHLPEGIQNGGTGIKV